ncbi:hypothetical protein SEUBUCD646_0P03640 [Saccharomyces eubayanus]|uniref:SEC7 domain-containing protein n=1 Tax=Saccharomyces eubayanus TaxID=1080349 RepID=A0ABN8VIS6_SACEU|nr:hypothetical protein SEUBUCD650_0P03650 [Saccharomyces eubayanus]CAI1815185.1 hypothetical protein SEUBUCD646_0P03640 [Saccharomyces eubayanus]
MSQSISSLIKLKFLQSHNSDKNSDRKDRTNGPRNKDKNREDEGYRRPFIQLAEIQEHASNDEDKANLREFKPTKKHSKLSRIRHKMSRLDLNFRSTSERGSEEDENADAQHNSKGQDSKEKHLISEYDTNSIEREPNLNPEKTSIVNFGSDNMRKNSKHISLSLSPTKSTTEKFPTSNRSSKEYRMSQDCSLFNGERLAPTLPTMSRISTTSSIGSSTAASRYFNPSKRNVVASSSSSSSVKFNPLHPIPIDTTPQIELAKQQDELFKKRFGRRRSRTVDVFDYIKKNNAARNKTPLSPPPFIRTIDETNASIMRPEIIRSHSPLLSDDNNISSCSTNEIDTSHLDHQKPSRSRSQSTSFVQNKSGKSKSTDNENYNGKLGLPHGSGPASVYNNTSNANSTIIGTSRRSSSIVNALSSFVNLRSPSLSSSKQQHLQQQHQLQQKLDISLNDLPPIPTPEFGDSCKDFLIKLAPYGKFIGVILTEKEDDFNKNCLSYLLTNHFEFKNDSLDIALRKLLMFLELPKESQQIDRLIMEFSTAYYKSQKSFCKKTGIECTWLNSDQVYFITFSLLMLHTDYFNPNNKCKMTKHDFVDLVHNDKYSNGSEVPIDILSYFYENVTAKESPKFNYFVMSPMALDDSVFDKDTFDTNFAISLSSNSMYSPIDMIKKGSILSKESSISPNYYPLTTSTSGSNILPSTTVSSGPSNTSAGNGTNLGVNNNNNTRPASNSISSYFSHNPSSGSSGYATLCQDDINIYSHILNDSLCDVNLFSEVSKYWKKNSMKMDMLGKEEHRYEKCFSIMSGTKGGYLRFHRSQLNKLHLPNFEILNDDSQAGFKNSEYKYSKILQMGGIMNLGMPTKKFSIVNSGKIHWKKEFAILTSFGLLICDKMDWINPQMMNDPKSGTSNYIIDFKSGFSFVPGNMIDVFNGLFADSERDSLGKSHFASLILAYSDHYSAGNHTNNVTASSCNIKHGERNFDSSSDDEENDSGHIDSSSSRSDNESGTDSVSSADAASNANVDEYKEGGSGEDDFSILQDEDGDCLLYLHTCHRNFIWKCANKYERDNWIDSINLFSAYDGCYVEIGSIANTICNKRKITVSQRLESLNSMRSEKREKLKKCERILMLLGKCVPISTKTRMDMINVIRQLAVRMDWLVYEIKRNELFIGVIKYVTYKLQVGKDELHNGKGDKKDQHGGHDNDDIDIDKSFLFNEDSLQECLDDSGGDEYNNE